MASQKLLVSDKERIKAALLERAFDKREEQQERDRAELGEALYQQLLGPHRAAMESLPEGWLAEESQITVRFTQRGDRETFPLAVSRRFPQCFDPTLDPNDPLAVKAHRLSVAKSRLSKEKRETKGKINQVLNQATTVKRLREIWPEAIPVIDEVLGKPQDKLPLPVLSTLNKTLGLPPDQE